MSLYRKYRPQKFAEVIGQEHVVQTLRGAITSDQVGHAYIFAGIRGTGKTSIARIFAKAVNCLNLKDSEPCGDCSVCKEISEGRFLDLIEIDAASNRGIDEIRDLKEKIRFAPNTGKYKVYIIDEVHMLTDQAFNALLKTLEEPPRHAVFILATTEMHKVPVTILSRCQRLDFHKVKSGKMLDGLKNIAEKEKIKVDSGSLKKIISISEGSVRDALSYLDQINSFVNGEEITLDLIEDILGYSGEEKMIELLNLIIAKSAKGAVSFIDGIMEEGKDLENFIKDFIRFLRRLLILKMGGGELDDLSDNTKVRDLLLQLEIEKIVSLIEALNDVLKNNKFSFLPQLLLEIELIKFIGSEETSKKETKTENKTISEKIVSEIKNVLNSGSSRKEEPKDNIEELKSVDEIEKSSDIGNKWSDFMNELKKEKIVLHMALQNCEIIDDGANINLNISNGFYFNRLNEKINRDFIESIFNHFYANSRKLIIVKSEKKEENRDLLKDALSVFGGELID